MARPTDPARQGVGAPFPVLRGAALLACALWPLASASAATPLAVVTNPAADAVVGGLTLIRVDAYADAGLSASTPVQVSFNNLWDSANRITLSTENSYFGWGSDAKRGVYDLFWDTVNGIVADNGSSTIGAIGASVSTTTTFYVRVTAVDATTGTTSHSVRVKNQGAQPTGSGFLLRRELGGDLCRACHAVKTHSSANLSTKYGSWGFDCLDCHTPHGTTNVMLVRNQIATPNSGVHTVDLRDVTSGVADYGLAELDGGTNGLSSGVGICETCHTLTQNGDGTPRFRNTGGGANGHPTTDCLACHAHADGYKAKSGDCLLCHGGTVQGSRRAVSADFGQQSHHVGAGGTMGGALTNYDCVVCHAEGTVDGNGQTDVVAAYHGGSGGTTTIDLKSSDNASVVYSYDKAAVAASAGAATNWHSGNAVWRTQTSTQLDPFCLSCHDSNGAVATYNATDGGSATNPFGDGATTNNYDQGVRAGVVDIASKVVGNPPPQGAFSVHAIRGQSPSRYTVYNPTAPPLAVGQTIYQFGGFTSMGTDENGKPNWNDTSVMGCADCHTTDGANGTSGNAHGSTSEYLLKDASGGATEGNLASMTYVCLRCHVAAKYQPGVGHTGNGSDYTDYTDQVGVARIPIGNTGGNFTGMACTNCHGGTQYGGIHGTSEVIGVGIGGGSGTRNAYRFMNGASMRYYDPAGWTGTTVTCYTLSGTDTPDTFGGCTKHGGKGAGLDKPLQRPIDY